MQAAVPNNPFAQVQAGSNNPFAAAAELEKVNKQIQELWAWHRSVCRVHPDGGKEYSCSKDEFHQKEVLLNELMRKKQILEGQDAATNPQRAASIPSAVRRQATQNPTIIQDDEEDEDEDLEDDRRVDVYHSYASTKTKLAKRSQHLKDGINSIQNWIFKEMQATLDELQKLGITEYHLTNKKLQMNPETLIQEMGQQMFNDMRILLKRKMLLPETSFPKRGNPIQILGAVTNAMQVLEQNYNG